jgi:hypothetical protein
MRDQIGYNKCIQAVDAEIGQEDAELLANLHQLLAEINAKYAACDAGCVSICQRISGGVRRTFCVEACQAACYLVFNDTKAFAYAGYNASLAALGIIQLDAYAHCWSLFPCAVPESSGDYPY